MNKILTIKISLEKDKRVFVTEIPISETAKLSEIQDASQRAIAEQIAIIFNKRKNKS